MVVALGADYDLAATPGLSEGGNEFYSFAGVERLREVLPTFSKGRVIVGVTSAPFKCPPAPSEAALLLHDYLTSRGVRDACEISLIIPFGVPIPPSPAASKSLLAAFTERGITFLPNRRVRALDPARCIAILDDESEMPYDLFLGIPKHRVPDVVAASGMAENDWIPVNPKNLKTKFPGVYAVGDVTSVGTAKAGTFSEGAASVVAASLLAEVQGGEQPPRLTLGRVPATSSLGEAALGAWTWTFFQDLRLRGTSSSPPSPWSERSNNLDPVAALAGSDYSEAFQDPLSPR
jgi:sulfide:quinone oxidoreductase